jgi:hypothetical protein
MACNADSRLAMNSELLCSAAHAEQMAEKPESKKWSLGALTSCLRRLGVQAGNVKNSSSRARVCPSCVDQRFL